MEGVMFVLILAVAYGALLLGLVVRMSRREDAPADLSELDLRDAPATYQQDAPVLLAA